MKRNLFSTLILSVFLVFNVFAQKGFINPSAKYAEILGYKYETVSVKGSGEKGIVHLPNGQVVDAWDFYKGKVAQDYSYATKYGYDLETETVTVNGYTEERAVCVRVEKGVEERIPLLEFMQMTGNPLNAEVENRIPSIHDIAQIDPNFNVAKTLPTSFDWRSYNGHKYIGDPRDQGSCGSCYAFGATACAEGTYNFATGSYDVNTSDFAESYIIWCLGSMSAYSSHFSGCNGADYSYSELQALVDIGTINESYFPYSQSTGQTCPAAATSAPKIKFASWNRVACSDVAAIKTAIMTYGVVDAAVYVSTAFQNYSGGVFSDASTACNGSPCENTTTNHAISLVGWGYDATYGDYWILRNSWGSTWGESGYMRLAATSARIACSVCYMTYQSVAPTAPTATSVAASAIGTTTATLNGTVKANNATTTVTFEYGLTTSYGSTVNASPSSITGATSTSVTGALTGLTSNTTYHFRVKAVNSVGTTYGSDLSFITTSPTAPTATSVAATLVTQTTATLNGTVNANSTSTTVTFEYGLTTSYGSTINASPNTVTGSTSTSVSAAITGLTASTTYHFRVKAVSTAGTTTGSDLSFTTAAPVTGLILPVTENFATSTLPTNWTTQNTGTGITERWSMSNTANAGGAAYELKCAYQNLNPGTTRVITPAIVTTGKTQLTLSFKHMFDDYGAGVTLRIQSSVDKVNWTNEAWSLASVSNTNIGPITVNTTILNNLNSTNTYIAFVVTGNLYQFDNWYIDNVSITAGTPPVIPTVTTTAASGITYNAATTGGNVTADGGATVTERGVCYATTANPTTSNSKVLSGTGTGTFTASLTGLTGSTTYYVRAYAINSAGTAYGTQISFATSVPPSSYCTANGTNITYEWIDYVGLGTIANTTTASTGGYGNYTSKSTSIKPGSTYTITFSAGYTSTLYTEYFKIWIDYNGDMDFTDAGELVASGSGKITGNLTASFTVPSATTLKTTRLRILMSDASTTTSPCGTFTYGEVEDYTVIISNTAKGGENDSFDGEPLSNLIEDFSVIYPNPVSNTVNIRLAENTGATITVYNIAGVEVMHTAFSGSETEINVTELPTGMYTVLVNDGCKQKFNKFIKK